MNLFQSQRISDLLLAGLLDYHKQEKYLRHEFVLMPDHFHLLITPICTLEKALQFIKGDSLIVQGRNSRLAGKSDRRASMIGGCEMPANTWASATTFTAIL